MRRRALQFLFTVIITGFCVLLWPYVHLDNSIALGSMVHAALMLAAIWICYGGVMKCLGRIERKQDSVLRHLEIHE